jgi:hypothetical protein
VQNEHDGESQPELRKHPARCRDAVVGHRTGLDYKPWGVRKYAIEPTKTIIHRADGTTTVIVIPRRSYLDTGTEVSVGDRSFRDYAFAPGGDPGRTNWTMGGPDLSGNGNYLPLSAPLYIPGFNPATPF